MFSAALRSATSTGSKAIVRSRQPQLTQVGRRFATKSTTPLTTTRSSMHPLNTNQQGHQHKVASPIVRKPTHQSNRSFSSTTTTTTPTPPQPDLVPPKPKRKTWKIVAGSIAAFIPLSLALSYALGWLTINFDDENNNDDTHHLGVQFPLPEEFMEWAETGRMINITDIFADLGLPIPIGPQTGPYDALTLSHPPPNQATYFSDRFKDEVIKAVRGIKVIEDVTIAKINALESALKTSPTLDPTLKEGYLQHLNGIKTIFMHNSPLSGQNSASLALYEIVAALHEDSENGPTPLEGEPQESYEAIATAVYASGEVLRYVDSLKTYINNRVLLEHAYKHSDFQLYVTQRPIAIEVHDALIKQRQEDIANGVGIEERQKEQAEWEVYRAKALQAHQALMASPRMAELIQDYGLTHPSLQFNLPLEAPYPVIDYESLPRSFVNDFSTMWTIPRGVADTSLSAQVQMIFGDSLAIQMDDYLARVEKKANEPLVITIPGGVIENTDEILATPHPDYVIDPKQIDLLDKRRALIQFAAQMPELHFNPMYPLVRSDALLAETAVDPPLFANSLLLIPPLYGEINSNHILALMPSIPMIPGRILNPSQDDLEKAVVDMGNAGVKLKDDENQRKSQIIDWICRQYDSSLPSGSSLRTPTTDVENQLIRTRDAMREMLLQRVIGDPAIQKMAHLNWRFIESQLIPPLGPDSNSDSSQSGATDPMGQAMKWAEYLALRRRSSDPHGPLDFTVIDQEWVPWTEGDQSDPRWVLYAAKASDPPGITQQQKQQALVGEVFQPPTETIGKIAYKRSRLDSQAI